MKCFQFKSQFHVNSSQSKPPINIQSVYLGVYRKELEHTTFKKTQITFGHPFHAITATTATKFATLIIVGGRCSSFAGVDGIRGTKYVSMEAAKKVECRFDGTLPSKLVKSETILCRSVGNYSKQRFRAAPISSGLEELR